MDWEDVKVIALAVLFVVGGMVLLGFLYETSRVSTEQRCKEQFGQEWVGRYEHYGSNFCLNDKGETRIPL